jgi:hypothetical protein
LGRCWLVLVLLGVLCTILNGLKPLQVDDTAYYYYAAQIAEHPLDPYGFEIFWYQKPEPANLVLAPPVLPYWWAAAIRLFGHRPFLWKMWLFPFVLVFVMGLHALCRRFCRGMEMPLVIMTVLSPTFLPSLNLMLDVPALALALGAATLFLRACDRNSPFLAAAAGLVAGIALQTKYTAFLSPMTMMLYAFVTGLPASKDSWSRFRVKVGLSLLAVVIALSVFVAWESFIARKYGESHFLLEYRASERDLAGQLTLTMPLFAFLGGAAPIAALLNLAALGRRLGVVAVVALLIFGAYTTVLCVDASADITVKDVLFAIPSGWKAFRLASEQLIYTPLGILVGATLLVIVCRLLRVPRGPSTSDRRRTEWFLALWLGLELAGYFVLTPFGAVRRIMGVVIAATLLAGRLASLTCRPDRRHALVWCIAGANVLLGLAFYAVDFRDATAQKEGTEMAAAQIKAHDPNATIWYVGHWGFQFYAERAGMRPVVPDQKHTPLHRGDWLVVPDDHIEQQWICIEPENVDLAEELSITDRLPLRTVRCFYGTAIGVPLEHKSGPRLSVRIYRVVTDFYPETPRSQAKPPGPHFSANPGCSMWAHSAE